MTLKREEEIAANLLRGVGDYGATFHVSQQDAEEAIKVAGDFLHAIETLIQGGIE